MASLPSFLNQRWHFFLLGLALVLTLGLVGYFMDSESLQIALVTAVPFLLVHFVFTLQLRLLGFKGPSSLLLLIGNCLRLFWMFPVIVWFAWRALVDSFHGFSINAFLWLGFALVAFPMWILAVLLREEIRPLKLSHWINRCLRAPRGYWAAVLLLLTSAGVAWVLATAYGDLVGIESLLATTVGSILLVYLTDLTAVTLAKSLKKHPQKYDLEPPPSFDPKVRSRGALQCPNCSQSLIGHSNRIEYESKFASFLEAHYLFINFGIGLVLMIITYQLQERGTLIPGTRRPLNFADIFPALFLPFACSLLLLRIFPKFRVTKCPKCGFTESHRMD